MAALYLEIYYQVPSYYWHCINVFAGVVGSQDWPEILATDAQSVLDTLQCGDCDFQEAEIPVDLDYGKMV